MKKLLACALALLSLAACAGNRDDAQADKITRAVINNDMSPVMNDLDPAIKGQITRVRVAELSDELNAQGTYQGLTRDTSWCRTGYICYDVKFSKRPYHEVMKVGSDGKVQYWWIRAAQPK
ncbi:MAG TPA: hypothetical protein VFA29_11985 [Candidatus Baltobacteraceae bacterium]|nr:hypothetical protein [Candidatus Baltobacteraceae bacterium]